jgi:hypothetical protein
MFGTATYGHVWFEAKAKPGKFCFVPVQQTVANQLQL